MAEKKLIFGAKTLCKINPVSKTLVNSIKLLVVSSYLYYLLLDADKLTDTAMFSVWTFYLLAFAGIFIARKKFLVPRIYKVPLYPFVPIIAIVGSLYVIGGMLVYQTDYALISILFTISGTPVYFYLTRGSSGKTPVPPAQVLPDRSTPVIKKEPMTIESFDK